MIDSIIAANCLVIALCHARGYFEATTVTLTGNSLCGLTELPRRALFQALAATADLHTPTLALCTKARRVIIASQPPAEAIHLQRRHILRSSSLCSLSH